MPGNFCAELTETNEKKKLIKEYVFIQLRTHRIHHYWDIRRIIRPVALPKYHLLVQS